LAVALSDGPIETSETRYADCLPSLIWKLC
jgi:hypothetical protein